MSLESDIIAALEGLVSNRVYPDIAPPGVEALPRITFQQVGGQAVNFLDNVPAGKKNARIQVNVWGKTRVQVAPLARQVEDTLKSTGALFTTILGAPVAIYEADTKLCGTIQDFSVWTDD